MGESTHGERLPGAIRALLGRQGLTTADVDRYAVALGPGSFTGLRVGIATVQGLALAHGRPVVGMPVLDVLVDVAAQAAGTGAAPDLILPWVDARRGEVFSALYEPAPEPPSRNGPVDAEAAAGAGWRVTEAPISAVPAAVLDGWAHRLRHRSAWVIGDGVAASRPLLDARLGAGSRRFDEVPSLARAMAAMAVLAPWRDRAGAPHALRPVYVRRPDAELARERRRTGDRRRLTPGRRGFLPGLAGGLSGAEGATAPSPA